MFDQTNRRKIKTNHAELSKGNLFGSMSMRLFLSNKFKFVNFAINSMRPASKPAKRSLKILE